MRKFRSFTKIMLMLFVLMAVVGFAPVGSYVELLFENGIKFLEEPLPDNLAAKEGDSFEGRNLNPEYLKDTEDIEDAEGTVDALDSGDSGDSGDSEDSEDIKNGCYSGIGAQEHETRPEHKDGTDEGKSDKELFLTAKEISSLWNIGLPDKLAGINILGKINKKDAKRIYSMIGGGITYDEMEEINGILEKSLTTDQIEKLKHILAKNKSLQAQGRISGK